MKLFIMCLSLLMGLLISCKQEVIFTPEIKFELETLVLERYISEHDCSLYKELDRGRNIYIATLRTNYLVTMSYTGFCIPNPLLVTNVINNTSINCIPFSESAIDSSNWMWSVKNGTIIFVFVSQTRNHNIIYYEVGEYGSFDDGIGLGGEMIKTDRGWQIIRYTECWQS